MMKSKFMDKLLGGVEVEWKTLAEIGIVSGAGVDKKKNDDEKTIKLLNYMDIYRNRYLDKDIPSMFVTATDIKIEQCNVLKGDIFFTPSSEVLNDIGNSAVALENMEGVVYSYHIMRLRLNNPDIITSMFISYMLGSDFVQNQINKNAKGSTRFGLTKTQWENLQIPIPPLKVQEEIVRILDAFTEHKAEHKAELKAELTARKKQYEYYRDKLLTFEEGEVEWKALGDVGEFIYGYAAKAQDSGDARFIRITDINMNGKLIPTDAKFVDISEESERFILKKNDLLMARTGATYGKTMIFEEDYPAIFAGFLIKLSFDKKIISPKYYWHFSQSKIFWYQANKLVSGGGQPQFNANAVREVKIPIPYPYDPEKSLAEQERIVSILDKFDALTSSITEGLSREIELCQKQYEYYRNMFLSFPKEKVEV